MYGVWEHDCFKMLRTLWPPGRDQLYPILANLPHCGPILYARYILTSCVQGFFGPRVPVDNLDAGIIGVSYFADKDLVNPVIISPDAGGVYRAKKFLEGYAMSLCIYCYCCDKS